MKQSDVLIRPFVTEKAMNAIGGTPTQDYKDGNKIEFLVHRDADKALIKTVFEERFEGICIQAFCPALFLFVYVNGCVCFAFWPDCGFEVLCQ